MESVYTGVVSLRGLRLVMFLAELNKLLVWGGDAVNAYPEALTKEKLYTIAGPELETSQDISSLSTRHYKEQGLEVLTGVCVSQQTHTHTHSGCEGGKRGCSLKTQLGDLNQCNNKNVYSMAQ